jgi:hypothetical protein
MLKLSPLSSRYLVSSVDILLKTTHHANEWTSV